jgi:integrase
MGRRGNGEGTIGLHRPSGRYMGRYWIDAPDGTRKRKTVYGKTREDARDALATAMGDTAKGLVYGDDNLKAGEYLDSWLADSVRDTVRQNTYERYEQITRCHLKPALGRIKLKNLTPANVRALYRSKLDAGLSGRTVQYIHTTLHKALKQAVLDGLIPRNVTEAVKAPKPTAKETRALDLNEVRPFFWTPQTKLATDSIPCTCWP